MKRLQILAALLLLTYTGNSQKNIPVNPYAAIDSVALQIPGNATNSTESIAAYISDKFKTDNDKARAAFIWVASNVEYDVKNMYALNFYEKTQDKIARTLLTRKGICADYAAVFNDICNKAGVKSYTIEGYTKQNGTADYVPHAWNGVKIDGTWYPFDVTWGSGYSYNNKFVRKINNSHFKAEPSVFIDSHMPFDYQWQFLDHPISNEDFIQGNTSTDKATPYFSYPDSIIAYEAMTRFEQVSAAARRVEQNGVKNGMIFDRLQHLRTEIENTKHQELINLYNSATTDFNTGVNDFNSYVNFKNKQFTPAKPDAEIQKMLTITTNNIASAKAKVAQLTDPVEEMKPMIVQLNRTISELETRVNEEQTWLNTYMKKNKLARRSMFYTRVTLNGIPIK